MAYMRHHWNKGVWVPLLFSAACVLLFAVIYRAIGPDKHFEITEEQKKRPMFASMYISVMAQSNAMGDATPKTILGRTLFAIQVATGWAWIMILGAVIAGLGSNKSA